MSLSKRQRNESWKRWVESLRPAQRGVFFGRHYGEHGALLMYGIPKRRNK